MLRFAISLLLLFSVASSSAGNKDAARIRRKLKAIPMSEKVRLNDEEWRQILSPAQFLVLRQGATEPAFQNEYAHTKTEGVYVCAACGNELFSSAAKFDSGTGWPSFTMPLRPDRIALALDRSTGQAREEVRCARCGSHLGHVFKDGPPPTHLRYCLNSAALSLKRGKQ